MSSDVVETVLAEASARFGVSPEQITGPRRFARYTMARHYVWACLRDDLGWSLVEIAERFGVDHTSVMYGVERARAWRAAS